MCGDPVTPAGSLGQPGFSVLKLWVGVLGCCRLVTCSLAAPLVFPHLAVLLAVAEPLQRDAEVIETLELVVCTALLTAPLQPIKAQHK